MNPEVRSEVLREILWESLEGGDYDLEELKDKLEDGSDFFEIGLDSLDMTDFFLRLEDLFKVSIKQEDFTSLVSVEAVRSFLEDHKRR